MYQAITFNLIECKIVTASKYSLKNRRKEKCKNHWEWEWKRELTLLNDA